ncbi:hypothetical protein Fcan01_09578 [Folsomia candida]|uniref:Uncharacterized protein n=1 Tax=Folsomia candida TaxID=158441 RepID=A0A226EGK0_FOLCA|nr:hypothetical protein Fcan01_09578 [Folsomia candida]
MNFLVILAFFTLVSGNHPNPAKPPCNSPEGQRCDPHGNNTDICPHGLTCYYDNTCKCGGYNQVFSNHHCECKLRAGTDGCRRSGDCTYGGQCYHYRYSSKTSCHCCEGSTSGYGNGQCPASDYETSNRCPDSFTCTGGACSCRSDQVVSEESCKCVIKAGNIGCMIASQCTDGAYCRHPHKKNGERQWSHCECCSGPPEGSNGFCPPDKCHGYGA